MKKIAPLALGVAAATITAVIIDALKTEKYFTGKQKVIMTVAAAISTAIYFTAHK